MNAYPQLHINPLLCEKNRRVDIKYIERKPEGLKCGRSDGNKQKLGQR